MRKLFAAALLAILGACAAFGQAGFEVVSIKPSDPLSTSMNIGISPGGSFEASGVTAAALIRQAYEVQDFQVSGGPGWMNTDKYEIVTKDPTPGPSEEDLGKMNDAQRGQFRDRMTGKIRAMLADRFQLKVHKETKESSVYNLTVAKNGPKLQTAAEGIGHSGLSSRGGEGGSREVNGKSLPIPSLAKFLSSLMGRTVLDKTALTGKYDFKLNFTTGFGDTTGPSVFTALQDQLGLKLEAGKGPVEVLVIDSIEKPSPN